MSCFSLIFDLLQKGIKPVFHIRVCLPKWVIKSPDWFTQIHPSTFVIRTPCSEDFPAGLYFPGYCPHTIGRPFDWRLLFSAACRAQCPMCHMQTTQSTCFSLLPDWPDLITVECSVNSSVSRPCESPTISAGPDGTAAVLIVPLMSPLIQVSSPSVNQTTLIFLYSAILGILFALFVCLMAFSFRNGAPHFSGNSQGSV